jgi:hypothetical protein
MSTRHRLIDEWRDAFLIQARLLDVPGAVIGEALAEIDAHCADSGQRPDEAFGDPVEYAKALAGGRPSGHSGLRRRLSRGTPMAVAALSGLMGLLDGVDAIRHGTDGVVTAGQLVFVVVGVVATVLIVAVGLAALGRPGRSGGRWLLGAVTAAGCGGALFVALTWQQVVARVPGWVLLAAGLVLLAFVWWQMLSGQLADRIIDPRTGREPEALRPAQLHAVVRWSLPVLLLTAVLLTVLLPT